MTDTRWHFGGPYGYEFDCQIIPPVGSGLSSRLESQAAVFLGQLESYRRASNLQSLTWYAHDSAGNFYEYGVIMGRPYAVIRVAGKAAPSNPVAGLSGIAFYHEAIRSSVLYTQGIVARDAGSKPSAYVMVDAPWNGYASQNKRILLGGGMTQIDERLMFKPHSVAWSLTYLVHVVVQRQINASGESGIFIGGFRVLWSDVVDFVGAQLYQDELRFAYIDPADSLTMASIPVRSIGYDVEYQYDHSNTLQKVAVPDFAGGEETVCNFHPVAPKASFLSARRYVVGLEYRIDYRLGEFRNGAWETDENVVGFVYRKSQSVTTSPHITSVVRTAVYYIDAGESYQALTAAPPHRITDDFSFTCAVPTTECRIDLALFPIWTGYDQAGVRTFWRLNGYASQTISGTIARSRSTDTAASDIETYSASVPSVSSETEIDLGIYKIEDGDEILFANYPVERISSGAGQTEEELTLGNNYVTAHCAIAADRFINVELSGTDETGASISVPMGTTATTTNSAGGSSSFNPNTNTSTSGTMRVPLISASSSNGWPSTYRTVRKSNAYQSIYKDGTLMVEDQGSHDLDVSFINSRALYAYQGPELGGMRDGLGPDPYSGPEIHGPTTVTRTVTYAVESNPSISANAGNNVFVSNYMGRGCLYDHRLRKHLVSPWGIFSSDVILASGGQTKNVYCVSGTTVLDITPDFLTAAPDSDATAKMPIAPVGNVLIDDFYDPRGLL